MTHRENSLTPHLGPAHPDVTPNVWDEVAGRWSDDDPQTDREKHDFCLRRTGACATFLPPAMYDRAAALDCDMRWFVKQQPIPTTITIEHKLPTSAQMRDRVKADFDAGRPLGANHVSEPPDHLRYAAMTRRGNPVRKHISTKQCSGKEIACLPGKSGACVACCDEE